MITDPNERKFGTGFVIYRDSFASYLLTCQHVINDVGAKQVRADGHKAQVIASGAKYLDLALLRVEGLLDQPVFNLRIFAHSGSPVITVGFQSFDNYKGFLARALDAKLGRPVRLRSKLLTKIVKSKIVKAWDLKIVDDYDLRRGYSGSPVIDVESRGVIGVVSHQKEGDKGIVMAIEGVKKIWPDVLPDPFQQTTPNGKSRTSRPAPSPNTEGGEPTSVRSSLPSPSIGGGGRFRGVLLFPGGQTTPQLSKESPSDQSAQIEIDRLTHKANALLAEARENPSKRTSTYTQALTLAALGKWLHLQKEPYRALILLQEALKQLPEEAEEHATIQTWHDLVSQPDQAHLNAMIYLANRGLRRLESPEQTLARDQIEDTQANDGQ